MANYTAADVKKLRDLTGSGMMDCKKALEQNEGDMDKAVEALRIKGAKDVGKRAGRTTANGVVAARDGAMIELNSETDFVAKNADFVATADKIAKAVDAAKADSKDAAAQVQLDDGKTVAQTLEDLAGTIGEKIEIRRVARVHGETVVSYLHKTSPDLPAQIGVIVAGSGDEQTLRDVAMHIAAFSPTVLTREEVDADTVAN